ncbi:hypothetical protein HY933_04055 [Candidatus Falkowbacteria bacterium]|nr:hypothetical protein [Candidatus Falkowbacteria bacterium]
MTNPVLIIIVAIVALFVLLLFVKQFSRWKFCVLCVSVSATWLGLLGAYWLGLFPYRELIAVLMGQSVVGLYYLAEKRLPADWQIWRLPFLLSLTVLAYAALGLVRLWFWPLAVLAAVWLLTTGLYYYRDSTRLRQTFERIVACCRDW